jgi:hypothetical protein
VPSIGQSVAETMPLLHSGRFSLCVVCTVRHCRRGIEAICRLIPLVCPRVDQVGCFRLLLSDLRLAPIQPNPASGDRIWTTRVAPPPNVIVCLAVHSNRRRRRRRLSVSINFLVILRSDAGSRASRPICCLECVCECMCVAGV